MQADSPAVGQRLDWCLLPKTRRHDRDTAVWSPRPSCLCAFLRSVVGHLGRAIVSTSDQTAPHRTLTRHPRTKTLNLERQQEGPAEKQTPLYYSNPRTSIPFRCTPAPFHIEDGASIFLNGGVGP